MAKTIQSLSPEPEFRPIVRDVQADGFASLLHRIRSELIEVMTVQGVSRKQLAERLSVNASVVTRVLDPTCDILVSTMFDFAWKLEKTWAVSLEPLGWIQERQNQVELIETLDEVDDDDIAFTSTEEFEDA